MPKSGVKTVNAIFRPTYYTDVESSQSEKDLVEQILAKRTSINQQEDGKENNKKQEDKLIHEIDQHNSVKKASNKVSINMEEQENLTS